MQHIVETLHVVANNSPTSIGGGGEPTAALGPHRLMPTPNSPLKAASPPIGSHRHEFCGTRGGPNGITLNFSGLPSRGSRR
jgi:hypothetical protein